jgi:hypothetical protein
VKLYWIAAESRYVHRQSDIPKGVDSERVDVPTDTEGLMAYLNDLAQRQDVAHVDPQPDGTIRVVDDVGAEFVGDRKAVIDWLNAGLDPEDVPDREETPRDPVRSIETVEVRDHDAPNGVRIEAVPPKVDYNQARDRLMSQIEVEDAIQRANYTELMCYGNNVFDRFRDLGREMEKNNGRNLESRAEPAAGEPQTQSPDGQSLA